MDSLEDIISNIHCTNSSSSSIATLVDYLTQYVAEKCSYEIDGAIARSNLQCRSISSSISSGSSHIEKRLVQRRLRSAVNYFGSSAKYNKIKAEALKQVEEAIHRVEASKNRPSTGFETLFSVDEFSDDDTLFLTNFSLNQSLKLSKEENLDSAVESVLEKNGNLDERLETLQKLSRFSPLVIFRSEAFETLLENYAILAEEPILYAEFLSLLANIANARDFGSFCCILESLQLQTKDISESGKINEEMEFKFVDLVRQMFVAIPGIARRRPCDDVSKLMSIFIKFFETFKSSIFWFIFSCIDPTAASIEPILHYHHLRQHIYVNLATLLTDLKDGLSLTEKHGYPNLKSCNQSTIWSLHGSFVASLIMLLVKYLPSQMVNDLDITGFLSWIMEICYFKKWSRDSTRANLAMFLQKKLLKFSENQAFADLLIKTLPAVEPLPSPITLPFARLFLTCLQTTTLRPPGASVQVIQGLLQSKQRPAISMTIQLIDKLYSSNFNSPLLEPLFNHSTAAVLLQHLHPLNPVHSRVLFQSSLSSSKPFWRQFRPRSILSSPGINYLQHHINLSLEDKTAGTKLLINFLTENSLQDSSVSKMDFICGETIIIPPAIEMLINFPGFLVEIIRVFDFPSFFDENFNTCLQTSNAEFLRRLALLMKNIDFMVECRKALNLPTKLITYLQQYSGNFRHKLVFEDTTLGCLELLKAVTLGSENELQSLEMKDFHSLRLTDLSKGSYRKAEKKPIKAFEGQKLDSYEDLLTLFQENANCQLPFSDILKQKIGKSSDPSFTRTYTLSPASVSAQWLYPIFNYAVHLSKASTWQFAHRQSILLKLPFYSPEGKDWFVAALFLATHCNAKLTSETLLFLCSSSQDIRAFWPASHESLKEFVSYLWDQIWPEICLKTVDFEERPKFGSLVNFVYCSGLGIMDFCQIEEYLLALIWGGKKAVVEYFLKFGFKKSQKTMG